MPSDSDGLDAARNAIEESCIRPLADRMAELGIIDVEPRGYTVEWGPVELDDEE